MHVCGQNCPLGRGPRGPRQAARGSNRDTVSTVAEGRTHITLLPMKLSNPTLSGVLVLIVLASAPFALSAMRTDSPPVAEGGALEDSMQILQGDTKKLDKALEKGDMETVVKLALEMQKAVWEGKVKVPEKAEAITDAKEKAAFVLGFRKQLIQLEKALLDLEVAGLDGKADEAKKIYNETIKPMKKEGHARYKG